jgi:hypothetical protein
MNCRPALSTAFEQDMCLMSHHHARIDHRSGFRGNFTDSGYEKVTIAIIDYDLSFFDPPYDHMVQGAGRIASRTSRHIVAVWY